LKITYTSKTGIVVYKSKMTHRMSKGGKKILQSLQSKSFLPPSRSTSLEKIFSWSSITAGIQIGRPVRPESPDSRLPGRGMKSLLDGSLNSGQAERGAACSGPFAVNKFYTTNIWTCRRAIFFGLTNSFGKSNRFL
jgi:hypothetical protein